jgi:uncharacterized protein YbjT (DUF2867 family)
VRSTISRLRRASAGWPVRALVREPAAPAAAALTAAGAELVRGDFDDLASLPPALDGAGAVFGIPPLVLGPSGPEAGPEVARGRALIDAAAAAGIEQVVFSTVASAYVTSTGPSGKALIERYLHDHIARPTVLRPVRFMTNYAEIRKRWEAGDRWHADIEALRVIHPGLRTLADWLAESGAAAIRARHTAS